MHTFMEVVGYIGAFAIALWGLFIAVMLYVIWQTLVDIREKL